VSPGSFSLSSLAGPDVISLEGLSGSLSSSNSEVFLGILTGGLPMASSSSDTSAAARRPVMVIVNISQRSFGQVKRPYRDSPA
jgi:hypothetical protein